MGSLRRTPLVALLVLAGCGGGGNHAASQRASSAATPAATAATGDLNACAGQVQDAGRNCYAREIQVIVDRAGDKPLPAVQQVAEASYTEQSGFLLANCHGIMHTVGREWAIKHHLTLDHLMASSAIPTSWSHGASGWSEIQARKAPSIS